MAARESIARYPRNADGAGPHHGGAILMCEQAAITDPKIRTLCASIISSQQAEIDRMKGMLRRLE